MEHGSYRIIEDKVIIRLRDQISNNADNLLNSDITRDIIHRCIVDLKRRNSRLLRIFDNPEVPESDVDLLIETLRYILKVPSHKVPSIVPGAEQFFRDTVLLNDFVEHLYNYWRTLQRLVICESEGDRFDRHPYRAFNSTIEAMTHLIRGTYRDVQENISRKRPRIYRQVRAGAEVGAIVMRKEIPFSAPVYNALNQIPTVRQVLIYPPLIFTPPMNKRTGVFERVFHNPLDHLKIDPEHWLCFPAKVGPLVIMIYFAVDYFELGFSLANLFEMADDEDLQRSPDAVYLYGVPEDQFQGSPTSDTIFYDDEENGMLVGAIPHRNAFGYFGYLKKMVLTLHNIRMMKQGRLPFHGALVNLKLRNHGEHTVLIMGDTGAGKSESLEALRSIGGDEVEDILIIADDMGSLEIDAEGRVIGYGTEIGAFVRLDDLQPGYAFGQIDRTIIMSPNQTNARVVIPVTTYDAIVQGFPIDYVLYANNYEEVDDSHPVISRFSSAADAIEVFRAGSVMSKGTTTTTGLVRTYFANVFGPTQYQELHESLAVQYFQAFFNKQVYVGQLRTQLGLNGKEHTGPEASARALLNLLGR